MEIKVGYFRTNLGFINQIIDVNEELDNIVIRGKDVTYSFSAYEEIFGDYKIANTPQELAQKDDVVEFELYEGCYLTRKVIDVIKDTFWIDDGTFYDVNDITKILTPNGKDYICQYEKGNE